MGPLEWVQKTLSEEDGSPSTKRQVFVVTMGFVLGICAGSVGRQGLTPMVVDLLKTALLAAGAAYTAGRFAEKPAA